MDKIEKISKIKDKLVLKTGTYKKYLAAAGYSREIIIDNPVLEEELLIKEHITPEDVIRLRTYTANYLCPLNANTFGIEFVKFSLRDINTGAILIEMKETEGADDGDHPLMEKPHSEKSYTTLDSEILNESTSLEFEAKNNNSESFSNVVNSSSQYIIEKSNHNERGETIEASFSIENCRSEDSMFSESYHYIKSGEDVNKQDGLFDESRYLDETYNLERHISYYLPRDILSMSTLGATIEFKVGNQEIKNLRMVELHFFKDKLIKIFDFNFGFCIPNSLNSWEHIYEIPKMPTEMKKEIIGCPHESRSETFYFVDRKLIIHNKADYSYE